MNNSCQTCRYWQGEKISGNKPAKGGYCEINENAPEWVDSTGVCDGYVRLQPVEDGAQEIPADSGKIMLCNEEETLGGHCDNTLSIEVTISPLTDEGVQKYWVSDMTCEVLPFLAEELVERCCKEVFATERDVESRIRELAVSRLSGMGFEAKVFTYIIIRASKRKGADCGNSGRCINLYMDVGSTNSKWIVSEADRETGNDLSFLEIASPMATKDICNAWGFSYDKASAYSLDRDGFMQWMGRAACSVMMRFSDYFKADVLNIRWAFPRIVHGKAIDFGNVGEMVTKSLRKRGLHGTFQIVAESDSLKEFFFERLKDLAAANDREMMENKRREDAANENRVHNIDERRRYEETERTRAREADEWKREHWFKKFFCDPQYRTAAYVVNYKDESWTRSSLMDAFRKTGARADGKFNLLMIDAGGSTLDYYYRSANGAKSSSGSFRAGGQTITVLWSKEKNIDFKAAEEQKQNVFLQPGHKRGGWLMDITRHVYEKPLMEIRNNVGNTCGQLCVIGTGLAMLNRQLQYLIGEVFDLPDGQTVLWSPGIVEMLPREMYSKMPSDFRVFDAIVRRKSGKDTGELQPWPSSDIVGGLYFSARRRN